MLHPACKADQQHTAHNLRYVTALAAAGDDLDAAPALFTATRLPDAHALQALEFDMASQSPGVDYRDALAKWFGSVALVVSMLIGFVLSKLNPKEHPMPIYVYDAIGDASVPFRCIRRNVQVGSVALLAAAACAAVKLALWVAPAVRAMVLRGA